MTTEQRIAILGATGYVGARLVLRLLAKGYVVHAIGRSYPKLQGCTWSSHPNVRLFAVDAIDREGLKRALTGCSVVYYLIHSMNTAIVQASQDYAQIDRRAAETVVEVVNELQISRLVYLGALGDIKRDKHLSKHLRSRAEVSDILLLSNAKVTVLRAGMIIGSGSASFEMLRYLVDRLPLMISPRWIKTPVQPIAIRNVLEYLVQVLEHEETSNGVFDIGGPEVVSYEELIHMYSLEAGLMKRWIITIPFISLSMSCLWVKLLTPLPWTLIQPLIEGLRNPVLCINDEITQVIPQRLLPPKEAIGLAIDRLNENLVASSWLDAGAIPPVEWCTSDDPAWSGGTLYSDIRVRIIDTPILSLWRTITAIGGDQGYYYGNWLWRLRGWIDDLFGGVGQGRGRRNSQQLRVGDALHLWRVKVIDPPHRLVLVSEMRLPGEAALEFTLRVIDSNHTELTQSARFLPRGVLGIFYWYAITPLHSLIFDGMLDSITKWAKVNQQKLHDGTKNDSHWE
jgi:uncharacterized protein YbjT (DUF2867 family)